MAWKGGHKDTCRDIVVQKNPLKGRGETWSALLRWMTVRALDFTNRPENHHNRCFEITLRETGSNDLRHAYEVIGGRVGPLNVREEVHFEPGSGMDEEDESQLYTVFLVMGEENEPIDAHGLSWNLQNSIHDTPERCEVWANRCVEVMKAVVAHGKPRQAIRDATVTMETGLLMRGELELCSVEALRGQG